MKKILIIGGVAGGMSAATRLRRLDERAEITVLERSGHVSYANCGLPYYIGGVISDEEKLILQTPESLHRRFRLDVRINTEAISIERNNHHVTSRNVLTGEVEVLAYDKLILSPGASPIVPQIKGIERAFTLRTVEDVESIVRAVENKPRSAVVIGGGFIGVEIAENLVHRSIPTTVIEASEQVLPPLDIEMASFVHSELRSRGVDLRLGSKVVEVGGESVRLSTGEEIHAELVLLAIGVLPDAALAEQAGLSLGVRGGIRVNVHHQTNDPDIYAIGDVAEKEDALSGNGMLVPLANLANRHGRVVADHITGVKTRASATIGTAIVKVFGLTIASTGWNEKRLQAEGKKFHAIHTHPSSHAGYYPDAKQMALKVLIDPATKKILGAQAVGNDGVDKRIDVLATAMKVGLEAPALADLELAYAPPFGSAKDPVNMIGYIAENQLSGLVHTAQWDDVAGLALLGYQILDVRTASEYANGSIPGAINIPVDELRERAREIASNQVLVLCQVGQRGHTATLLLRDMGFAAVNLDGGYRTWLNSPASSSLESAKGFVPTS